ncbi:hypothetical protein [Methylobacterium oxalidis]|uniref:hypothetical protein n=1 Tax=Methylobacterium oxalidis TaxID=944322 RepID=UPI003314C55F
MSATALPLARRPLAAGAAGLAALALALVAVGWREAALSLLAAWLAFLGLAVSALPLVVALDRVPGPRPGEADALLAPLRLLLALTPAAALLGLPVLLAASGLFPLGAGAAPPTPLAALWFTPGLFALRIVLYLAAWTWLALALGRGAGPHPHAALFLHAVIGTLFVTDVVASLDHRLGSSLMGLLILTAWSGLALAAAILIAPPAQGDETGRAIRLLVGLTAAWAFLHFLQVFVVWSANLPEEVLWYFARGGLAGRTLAVLGGLLSVAGLFLLLRPGARGLRLLAAALVALHAVEMLWFVAPGPRGRFAPGWPDALCLVAMACLALAALPLGARLAAPGLRRGAAA